MYGDRVNQLDVRVAKRLMVGKVRATVNADVYNVLNVNPVLAEISNYTIWRRPQRILVARFVKFGVQLEF